MVPSGWVLAISFCLGLGSGITEGFGAGAQTGSPPPPSNQLYGFITTNTTLTHGAPGPVYDVLGDLIVNPGVTLSIEPGVTLQFAADHDTLKGGDFPSLAELDVRGSLIADATAGDSIRFIASEEGGAWGQVKVELGGTITLMKAKMQGATVALSLRGSGSKTVANVAIVGGNPAIFAVDTGTLSISDALIVDCSWGIFAPNATGTVRRCVISGLGTSDTGMYIGPGIEAAAPDSTRAEPTVVAGFFYGVLLAEGASVRNVLARDCRNGFACNGAATINYCTAVRNAQDGLVACRGGLVLNSIAASNNVGVRVSDCYAWADYVDSWGNGTNFSVLCGGVGANAASFDPFFVDPAANDFRLADNSVFKHFSNSGGEIGAYGPGTCQTVEVGKSAESATGSGLKAWPNPARGPAALEFDHPVEGQVTVDIQDILGRRIRRVADGFRGAGIQRLSWDGRDDHGRNVPPGLYFWRVASGSEERIGRLVIAR